MNVTTYTITYTVHNGMQWPREWPKTNGEAAHATINLLDNALSGLHRALRVTKGVCVCVCVFTWTYSRTIPSPPKNTLWTHKHHFTLKDVPHQHGDTGSLRLHRITAKQHSTLKRSQKPPKATGVRAHKVYFQKMVHSDIPYWTRTVLSNQHILIQSVTATM